jgi:hypothetical protein
MSLKPVSLTPVSLAELVTAPVVPVTDLPADVPADLQAELPVAQATPPRGKAAPARATKVPRMPNAPRHTARALRRLFADDGAATAEYAVATMAAVGFAGLLIVILRGDEVRVILTDLVRSALSVG